MNKLNPLGLAVVLAMVFGGLAWADQLFLNTAQNEQATRACSFDAVDAQKVTTSGTSAPTTNATGKGAVRIVCTQAVHFKQGASPTATADDQLLPAGIAEYFYSPNVKFAFIQDTTGGICWVASCK